MRTVSRALILVGVLLSAPAAMAQTIDAPLRVRTGEVYTVAVEQSQTSAIAGTNVEATFSHSYALHIVDAEQGIWRYVPATMSYELPTGLGIEAQTADINWPIVNEGVSAFARLAMDIGFECRVDAYGRCIEMTNWPMWRERAENVVLMADAFARLMPEGASDDDVVAPAQPGQRPTPGVKQGDEAEPGMVQRDAFSWARMREPVLRGVATILDNFDARDAATSMATIQGGAFLQGRSLTRRQDVAVSDELDMPFGAPPMRFTGTLRLERINQRDNTATVVRRVTLDEASARATLLAMSQFATRNVIEPIAAASGEADSAEAMEALIEPMLNAIAMRYNETTTATVDLASGMARETVSEYTLTVAPPAEGGADTPVTIQGRTVIRVTLGAPAITRLPRQ